LKIATPYKRNLPNLSERGKDSTWNRRKITANKQ
jgi:hypothetical protein